MPTKKTALPLVTHLSRPAMHAMLEAPDVHTRPGLRDRARRHLWFAAGLRVSELRTRPLTAITCHPTPAVRVLGKGRRERSLPRWKQTADELPVWLGVRGHGSAPALFLNAQGRVMTREGLAYVLRQDVRRAAPRCPSRAATQVTPQVLRHPCALMILHATGDLRNVSLWLGHADMQTTDVYRRAAPTDTMAALATMLPPALRRGRLTVPDTLIAS